jgi:hypothetical protein
MRDEGGFNMIKRVLFWDWKGQPDLADLQRAIREMSANGPIHLTEVPDTGMDVVAVIIAHRPLSPAEANEQFRTHLEESND